jgi:hypothetical protein
MNFSIPTKYNGLFSEGNLLYYPNAAEPWIVKQSSQCCKSIVASPRIVVVVDEARGKPGGNEVRSKLAVCITFAESDQDLIGLLVDLPHILHLNSLLSLTFLIYTDRIHP